MALQGSFSSAVKAGHALTVIWQQTQYPEENRSSVTASLYYTLESGYSLSVSSRDFGNSISIDGTSASFIAPALDFSGPASVFLGSFTHSVSHLSDGRCSVTIAASYRLNATLSGVSYGTVSAAAQVTLSPLGSASGISSYPAQLTLDGETPFVLTVSRSNSSYCHKIILSLDDYVLESPAFTTRASLLIPQSWLSAFPSSLSAAASCTLYTYASSDCSVQIGEPQTVSVTLRCPEDAGPGASPGWFTLSALQPEGATLPEDLKDYIQGVSHVQAAFDESLVDASRLYGASIAGFLLTADGMTARGPLCSVGPLSTVGDITVRLTVSDTRGRYYQETQTLHVAAYTAPALTQASIYRCDASGLADEDGGYIRFYALPVIASLSGKNAARLSARYRSAGGVWSAASPMTAASPLILGGSLDSSVSYEGEILLLDSAGGSAVYTAVVSTKSVTVHLRQGGKAVGLGKYAEQEEVVDSAWPVLAPRFQASEKVVAPALEIPLSSLWQQVSSAAEESGVSSCLLNVRYSPLLGVVFLSGSCVLSASVSAGGYRHLSTLSDHPPADCDLLPLSCLGPEGARVYVTGANQVFVYAAGSSVASGVTISFSGAYYAG